MLFSSVRINMPLLNWMISEEGNGNKVKFGCVTLKTKSKHRQSFADRVIYKWIGKSMRYNGFKLAGSLGISVSQPLSSFLALKSCACGTASICLTQLILGFQEGQSSKNVEIACKLRALISNNA